MMSPGRSCLGSLLKVVTSLPLTIVKAMLSARLVVMFARVGIGGGKNL